MMHRIANLICSIRTGIECSSISTCAVLSQGSINRTDGRKDRPFKRQGRKKVGRDRKRIAVPFHSVYQANKDAPWSSVYQGPHTYDPFVVPIPIRMGRAARGAVPPTALGNLELMKIPNFLHLTPPTIKKHCEALKPLCTPWPKRLPYLPLKIETRNYVFADHSVRHPGARKVVLIPISQTFLSIFDGLGTRDYLLTLQIHQLYLAFHISVGRIDMLKLKDLSLSTRSREKMISLSGSRYNSMTDSIRIVGKSCPTRKQNMDYAMYLLKVLYLESNKIELFESS